MYKFTLLISVKDSENEPRGLNLELTRANYRIILINHSLMEAVYTALALADQQKSDSAHLLRNGWHITIHLHR